MKPGDKVRLIRDSKVKNLESQNWIKQEIPIPKIGDVFTVSGGIHSGWVSLNELKFAHPAIKFEIVPDEETAKEEKKAYLVDFAILVRVVTDEQDPDKIVRLAAEKLKENYSVGDIIENASDPEEDIEFPYDPKIDDQ